MAGPIESPKHSIKAAPAPSSASRDGMAGRNVVVEARGLTGLQLATLAQQYLLAFAAVRLARSGRRFLVS